MSGTFDNWKVVVLSVLGATTFWFFNALNKNYDARINYPVEFQFERENVVIMKPLPQSVSLDVSSGGWNLLRKTFWFNVKPIQITLENPTEIGYFTRNSLFPIITDQLGELKVNYLVTDTLFIDIEKKRTKKVAIGFDSLSINLAENHRLVSPISIDPDSVVLTVPQSCYDTLGKSYLIQLESKGISSDYDREVDIILPNEELCQVKPEKARVKFDVDKFDRKSLEIPVELIHFPKDSTLMPQSNSVQVFYTIRHSLDEEFSTSDFSITADLNTMSKDSTILAVLVLQPLETIEVEVIPTHIKVQNVKR